MSDSIDAIDAKIAELERKLIRLQKLAAEIPVVTADIEALRRSRTLLGGKVDTASIVAPPQGKSETTTERPTFAAWVLHRSGPDSVPSLLIDVLRSLDRPAHIRDIEVELKARGREVPYKTLTSYLSRFAKSGIANRTAESTYQWIGKEEKEAETSEQQAENSAAQTHSS
jgi:hypothetical protein